MTTDQSRKIDGARQILQSLGDMYENAVLEKKLDAWKAAAVTTIEFLAHVSSEEKP
jgi:hypothetical protein